MPSRWSALAALVFGLAGAILNAKASDFLFSQTGAWGGGVSDEAMHAARRWSWPGWACIGAAFVSGFVAELVR